MSEIHCPHCNCICAKNGTYKRRQRWRCTNCGRTHTIKHAHAAAKKSAAKEEEARMDSFLQFMSYIDSKYSQKEMDGTQTGRTFRRKTSWIWDLWPISMRYWDTEDVIHLDAIHIRKKAVVAIAMTPKKIIGWHIGAGESNDVWVALLSKIQAPQVVVIDNHQSLQAAVRLCWPNTHVQMCLKHVQRSMENVAGKFAILQAHKEFRLLALALTRIDTHEEKDKWIRDFYQWDDTWSPMIDGKAPGDLDHVPKKRTKIRQKRNTLRRLIENGTLFTYLNQKNKIPDVPKTNNAIENQNRQIRGVIEHHRGFNLYKQLQTVCWYCYKRTKTLTPTQLPDHVELFLKATPTRDELEQCLNSNDKANRRYQTAKELAKIEERERHRINKQGKRHRRRRTKKKYD